MHNIFSLKCDYHENTNMIKNQKVAYIITYYVYHDKKKT